MESFLFCLKKIGGQIVPILYLDFEAETSMIYVVRKSKKVLFSRFGLRVEKCLWLVVGMYFTTVVK